jgi:hypothetical protein
MSTNQLWWFTSIIPSRQEDQGGLRLPQVKLETPFESKKCVPLMVSCLVSKCEALSSNPSTTKTATILQNIKLYLTRIYKTLLMKEKPGN